MSNRITREPNDWRFIYWTDTHYKDVAPISRMDDFPATMRGKIEAVADLAEEYEVDFVAEGGDLWDRSMQKPWEILQMHEALRRFRVPIYSVIGNHPVRGTSFERWRPHSGHQVLIHLMGDAYRCLDPVTANFQHRGLTVRLDHRDIVKVPITIPGWDHIVWDDYRAEGATVLLVSHFHPQQGHWVRGDGLHFVSPGALSRGTLGEDNFDRRPSVALVTCREKDRRSTVVDVQFLVVPHQPAALVLDEKTFLKVEDLEADEEKFKQAVDTLKRVSEGPLTHLTANDYLNMAMDIRGCKNQEVRDYCTTLMEELRS